MTFAPFADTGPGRSTAHEKAVDMVLGDRAMVSRLLREHQILFEAFEHSPAALAVHDAQGALVAWNARHDWLQAEDGDAATCRVEGYTLPSGLTARLSIETDADGEREGALIRERDAAVAANRAKDDFLASMSHEIRTPMNGLIGMAGLLADSDLTSAQQVYADVVLRSGRALLAITDDILDLSKIEAGRMELVREPFDIADSIEQTAVLFAANAEAKGLDLIVRVSPVLPRFLIGDESRLNQIVANLVGNAVKFTNEGHVMVDLDTAMATGDDGGRIARLTCRVQDTGKGIAPDLCERIFERFSQADRIAHRAQEGTGLGLAIVAAMIDEMGGTVGVESVEGEGTTFSFTVELPVARPDTMRMASETLWGRRVMIVDGEGPRRDIVAESVRAWGFDVAPCRSLRESAAFMQAMEARNRHIDLVLLGERVAEGDASFFMDMLAERAARSGGPMPPVILMTRPGTVPGRGEGGGTAPFETLLRPVRSACLLESMERALGSRTALSLVEDGTPVSEGRVLPHPAPLLRIEGPRTAPARDDAGASEPQGPLELPVDILVAEDNEINRFLIEEILRESGYSYRIVRDGVEAVEAWRILRPRLILMDMRMPRMGGEDATRLIRAEERDGTRTPVVALTAHALHGDRDRCLGAGMDDHLTKPVTIASIMRTVDFHLHPSAGSATA